MLAAEDDQQTNVYEYRRALLVIFGWKAIHRRYWSKKEALLPGSSHYQETNEEMEMYVF